MNESSHLIQNSSLCTATGDAVGGDPLNGIRGSSKKFLFIAFLLGACVSSYIHTRVITLNNSNDGHLLEWEESIEGNEDNILLQKSFKKHHERLEECLKDKKYSKVTAKAAYDMPFAALFKDTRGEKKFEASGITKQGDVYYAICDNSWAISKFTPDLTPFSDNNIMIGDPNREKEDSGYEAIFAHENMFYVVRESVEHLSSDQEISYHAIIEELSLGEDDYDIIAQCKSEFEFEGTSKGFEGAIGIEGTDGELYILGLCEGNFCSEKKKNMKGNGRIVLMKKNNNCLWETVKQIHIPADVSFTDYSDISITPNGKVAITTQEDSAVYLGQLLGVKNGKIDPAKVTFDDNIHEVYTFPKSDVCQTIYCNIEGVTFINDDMLMVVSDKMKSKGKQDFHCLEKDQSIHAFVLP